MPARAIPVNGLEDYPVLTWQLLSNQSITDTADLPGTTWYDAATNFGVGVYAARRFIGPGISIRFVRGRRRVNDADP